MTGTADIDGSAARPDVSPAKPTGAQDTSMSASPAQQQQQQQQSMGPHSRMNLGQMNMPFDMNYLDYYSNPAQMPNPEMMSNPQGINQAEFDVSCFLVRTSSSFFLFLVFLLGPTSRMRSSRSCLLQGLGNNLPAATGQHWQPSSPQVELYRCNPTSSLPGVQDLHPMMNNSYEEKPTIPKSMVRLYAMLSLSLSLSLSPYLYICPCCFLSQTPLATMREL